MGGGKRRTTSILQVDRELRGLTELAERLGAIATGNSVDGERSVKLAIRARAKLEALIRFAEKAEGR